MRSKFDARVSIARAVGQLFQTLHRLAEDPKVPDELIEFLEEIEKFENRMYDEKRTELRRVVFDDRQVLFAAEDFL